jgi:glucokinase
MKSNSRHLLAGDIGATKTTLALFDVIGDPRHPINQRTFQNTLYPSFDDILHEYLTQGFCNPTFACFGVAGHVTAKAVKMTNLNWSIVVDALKTRHGFSQVFLINDLVATATGALHLPPTDLYPLNRGAATAGAVIAVLAPGSGLGEAFLVEHDGVYQTCSSEGGHASFAPRNTEQIDLLTFMLERHKHVSVERVCSGLAIPELFAFLATKQATPVELQTKLASATDQTPVIIQAALLAIQEEDPCNIAAHTLKLFADILADEAANLALKTLALGGLFLGGGLASRLLPFLTPERFMPIFARGVYQDLLSQIPIHIILNSHTALLGAAAFGTMAIHRYMETAPDNK